MPGTDAYDMRTADAEPDQFEVIPESSDLLGRSHPSSDDMVDLSEISVPKTVVQKAASDSASEDDNGMSSGAMSDV